MKKFITAVLLLSTVFFSCNQAVNGEYATVVLDLGGSASGARAIGQNGLPFLKDTHITIEAVGRVGGTFVKEFAPGEAGSIALRFIAGDTVRLRVKASNASGIWSGSTTFTVEEGTNAVSVKLNKTISGAQALTFSMEQTGVTPSPENLPVYHVDLYAGNKKIDSKDNVLSPPSLCRDAKGRIFVAYYYKEGGDTKIYLVRCDSEGNNPTELINTVIPSPLSHRILLASDLVKEKVYLLDGDKTLYEVGETGAYTSWRNATISGFAEIDSFAVHDRQLFVLGKKGSDYKLYVYDINMQLPANQIGNEKPNSIGDPPSGISNYQYTDMFVTDDAVYLLRKDYSPVPDQYVKVYSKGALIKYEYNKVKKKIDDREEFGKSKEGAQNGIVLTPASCFYGPLKFIGFDDDVLYIADDGVTFEYLNKRPHIAANKNRIASFNTATESLLFTDTSATWEKEEKILPRKTLLWKKSATGGFDYYAVDSAESQALVPFSAAANSIFTDVFCYDRDANLYILLNEGNNYKVACYESTADGSYDFAHFVETNSLGAKNITAIAVDTSGAITDSLDNSYNALYYYYVDTYNGSKIKRWLWKTTQKFSDASEKTFSVLYELSPPSSKKVTALVANKDGLFAAVRENDSDSSVYTIEVRKYTHDETAEFETPVEIVTIRKDQQITIMDSTEPNHPYLVSEQINALHIQDDILYALSTKRKDRSNTNDVPGFFFMSGKLFKLGKTDNFGDDFDAEDAVMYGADEVNASSSGDFAPYRFIAVKPKKLVIASDGAYGQNYPDINRDSVRNKNRVFEVNLNDDESGNTKVMPRFSDLSEFISFSRELSIYPSSGHFDWK